MTVKGYRLRVILFAVISFLIAVNALRLGGREAAHWGDSALQTATSIGAIVCGLLVARRVSGASRLWRLLAVAATTSWLVAQALWWWQIAVVGVYQPSALADVGYYAFPLLALTALVVLARSGTKDAAKPSPDHQTSHTLVTTILDGLLATAAFTMFVWLSHVNPADSLILTPSGGRPAAIVYLLMELVVVVAAVVLVLAHRPDRRYRANVLLLAAGIVTVISSDRLVAYLDSVDANSGLLWARSGFVLGPLLIAFAMLELQHSSEPRTRRTERTMDWAQLVLPYLGALGIAVLIGFHILTGHQVDGPLAVLGVVLIVLMIARQLVSLRQNRLLLNSVYAGQRRLIHRIHHDSLTDLPNRLLFAHQLEAAAASGQPFVVVYIDLDDFKDVNDQFGHAAGDQLLDAVGQRLRDCARASDTVARIGGDEFGILGQGDLGDPEVFADRYRAALRLPFALHGSSVKVRASMGLVMPDPNEPNLTGDDLLRRADTSMYAGKRMGKDALVVYGPSTGESVDFPAALRRAGGRAPAGFSLVYQYVVRLPDATPVAIEALARWTAGNGTQIPPETFVSAAEAAGLGADLDAMVLDIACREVMAAGMNLPVHVNVCAARLGNSAFEQVVMDTLIRHRMAPSQLVIEITETVPIVDLPDGAAAIERLQDIGVIVALDDFGAGYNSLTYLHALPLDLIKLDRSMTIGIEPNHDAALYRSVMTLCNALGFDVIAEGIETQAQADTILGAGCQLAQGYLFGRPAPMAALISPQQAIESNELPEASGVYA